MTDSVNAPAEPTSGGAIDELARDDVERKKFLKMAGRSMGSAAAATALGAFIAACGGSSSGSSSASTAKTGGAATAGGSSSDTGNGDLAIVNYARTLEYLETAFYTEKAKSVGLSGEAKSLAAMLGAQESEHVQALTGAVKGTGGTPVKKPMFAFPVSDQAGFLKLAYTLENVGVGAYNGAAPALSDPHHLAAAGSIVQVEARHAAAIALLVKKPVTPSGAFDKPLNKSQVLAAAGPLIKKG